MRTINFRGKRIDTGEWVFGDLIHRSAAPKSISSVQVNGCGIDPETVGQFTGLLDKNGKEIYEGDIIQDGSNSIGVIMWFGTGWGIASYARGFNGINSYTAVDSFYSDEVKEWTILGNVYDNPELLEGGNQ